MMEVYVVCYETNDDGDIDSGVLGRRFAADRCEARRMMEEAFREAKRRFDRSDDMSESVDTDFCLLSVNGKWEKTWWVVRLTGKDE